MDFKDYYSVLDVDRSAREHETYRHHVRQDGFDSEYALQITLPGAFHGAQRVLSWEDGRKIDAKIPPGVKTGPRVRFVLRLRERPHQLDDRKKQLVEAHQRRERELLAEIDALRRGL